MGTTYGSARRRFDAIAHSTMTFAETTSAETTSAINGTTTGSGSGALDLEFKGSQARK